MTGLIDSNVLVAATDSDHVHHVTSLQCLNAVGDRFFSTSVHCLSECYSTLTRDERSGGSGLEPHEADAALDRIEDALQVLALSVEEQRAALRSFADTGGRGPRVYDFLIGYLALRRFLPALVTWNTRHFISLFPSLRVVTPAEYMETL